MPATITTLAGLVALTWSRHRPPRSPRPRPPQPNSVPPRSSSRLLKAADPAGIAIIGATAGVIGIGATASRIGDFGPRYGLLNGVRSTRCPDLGSCVGVCRICLDSRISPGLPERRKRHHRWQHWQGRQERRPQSRPARVVRLRKVTALVPEDCAEGFRQFARELRRGQQPGARPAGRVWRRLSPSAELMVDLQSGARCTIRYTELPGRAVTIGPSPYLGEPDPMASERTGEIGEARRAIG